MNVTSSSFERFKKFVGSKKKEKSSVISENPHFLKLLKVIKIRWIGKLLRQNI